MKRTLQICVLSVIALCLCSNYKKGKLTTSGQTEKDINYEISFHAYNKLKFEKFVWPSSMANESLTNILSQLKQSVIDYEPDTLGEYYTFYKGSGFIPLSSYMEQAKARKLSLIGNLASAEEALKGNQVNKDKFDQYWLLISCSETFREDWLISPNYSFSNGLIDTVLKGQHELLYHQYLYDNNPKSRYHLPILEKLNFGDQTVINPHFIDAKHADLLINVLNQYKVDHNNSLEKEIRLFRHLLQNVISGEIILALNNHSQ